MIKLYGVKKKVVDYHWAIKDGKERPRVFQFKKYEIYELREKSSESRVGTYIYDGSVLKGFLDTPRDRKVEKVDEEFVCRYVAYNYSTHEHYNIDELLKKMHKFVGELSNDMDNNELRFAIIRKINELEQSGGRPGGNRSQVALAGESGQVFKLRL